jgi:hypothetical protein
VELQVLVHCAALLVYLGAGLGLRFGGYEFKIWSLRLEGPEVRVYGSGFIVWGLEVRAWDIAHRI